MGWADGLDAVWCTLPVMSDIGSAEALRRRFGLPPVSESVARLTRLVGSHDADLDEISRLITQDKSLTARLLRAANPALLKECDYDITDVDQALMRSGMGPVLLLALGDPLARVVVTTFHSMVAIRLTLGDRTSVAPIAGRHLLVEVEFSGRASGRIHLRLTREAARLVAARILGLESSAVTGEGEIEDVISELVNIIGGNVISNLCDAGLNCRLTPPTVVESAEFPALSGMRGLAERMAFVSPEMGMFLDVNLDPWSG